MTAAIAVAATTTARKSSLSALRAEETRFERLIAPHRDGLRAYAQRLTRSSADAEDLLQETLLRVYVRRETLRAGEAIGGYLRTTLRRLFINEYHRRRARPGDTAALSLEAGGLPEPPDTTGRGPEAAVMRRLEKDAVQRALTTLPPHYQQPLVLCDQEGLTYEEIATRMELPLGTVRSRIARARRRVQRALVAWRD